MVEQILTACRVLVVEDEYALADELRYELTRVGATVIGPVGQLQRAIDLVTPEVDIDVAVLDVNLGDEAVYPLADLLATRGVRMIFATGYEARSIPSRFAHVPTFVKPVAMSALVEAVIRSCIQRSDP